MLASFVRNEREGLSAVHLGTVELNATRIICAMILHMTIMAEVKCGLDMLRFAKNNPHAFYGSNIYPMIICIMKLFGGFQCEISNVFLMIES